MGRIAALVISCTMLCTGCVVTAHPDRIPPVRDAGPASFSGTAVLVQSVEQDASPYPILTSTGVDVGFVADRKAWSRQTAEALAGELARRGAQIRTTAPLKLGVAVTSIALPQTGKNNQFTVNVRITASSGWSKDYQGSAEAVTGMFETVDGMSHRLSGIVLSQAIRAMLEDPEFVGQLRKR